MIKTFWCALKGFLILLIQLRKSMTFLSILSTRVMQDHLLMNCIFTFILRDEALALWIFFLSLCKRYPQGFINLCSFYHSNRCEKDNDCVNWNFIINLRFIHVENLINSVKGVENYQIISLSTAEIEKIQPEKKL